MMRRDAVRIRWLALEAVEAADLARFEAMLDGSERARAARFRRAEDRASYVAAHALLRRMLSDVAPVAVTAWRFRPGRFGKPLIDGPQAALGLQFSLSHTRGCVACAVGFQPVGIDVEQAGRVVEPGVAERFFAPDEIAFLRRAAPAARGRVFVALWTLKEAFLKATGEGLRRELSSFAISLLPLGVRFARDQGEEAADDPEAWHFAQFAPGEAYIGAVAMQLAGAAPSWDARAMRAGDVR